jgi:integrase
MNDQPSVSCENCKNYRQGNRKPGSSPRKPQRLPEVLTHEEQEALLGQLNAENLNGLRNLCLLRLMLNAGLRASEVIKVKTRDIDWSSGKLMVRQGKGKKDRSLWVGDEDLALLKLWVAKKAWLPKSELVFTKLQRQTDLWSISEKNGKTVGNEGGDLQGRSPPHTPPHIRHGLVSADQKPVPDPKGFGALPYLLHRNLYAHRGRRTGGSSEDIP